MSSFTPPTPAPVPVTSQESGSSSSCSLLPHTPIAAIHYGAFSVPVLHHERSSGFASPAADTFEQQLDLNDHLITNRAATFFVRAQGEGMNRSGIFSGDLLIIDRSRTPREGNVVLVVLEGKFLVRHLHYQGTCPLLVADSPPNSAIPITDETEFEVWGVVTNVIHSTISSP